MLNKPPKAPKVKPTTARPPLRFTNASSAINRDDEDDFMIDEDSENEGAEQL